MNHDIPKLKQKVLTDKISLALDSDLKMELVRLKTMHGVDVSEWLRRLIRKELPKLKEQTF